MPMPHADMKRLIQKRLRGTDGAERLRVARECMSMLPGYKQGPYADLRKWLAREMETTQTRRDVRHAEGMFVPRDGDARIVLLGAPNAGKSSLLRSLCGSSVQVGDYAFTTLRPIAATALINEARLQLVEIPGLIEGAKANRGSGLMYLGAAQDADGFLLVMPLDSSGFEGTEGVREAGQLGPAGEFDQMMAEVEGVIRDRPAIVAATKADLPRADAALAAACARFPGFRIVPVSTVTGQGLEELAGALWEMTGLMRVYSREGEPQPRKATASVVCRDTAEEIGAAARSARPFVIPRGCTVQGLAFRIHHDLAEQLEKAAVWGQSAKFPGQIVGKDHVLQDGDSVRLIKKRG